jgi:hypothetical protein
MTPRQSFNDRLEAFFREHANEWVNSDRIAEIAGKCAWRTRISNLRTERGLTIENRLQTKRRHAADCPRLYAWDIAPCTCEPVRYTVSYYRYVPAVAGDDFQLVPEVQEARCE